MQEEVKKLSLRRKLAFATCDIFGGGVFNIINFIYPGYIVLAIGLPAYYAGVVILIARIFDAVIDPVLGYLSDRVRVRFNSRRVTMLISAPLVVVSMFLMFYPHSDPSIMVRFWAALLSYLLFALVQSSVMIPYYSLASEMTDDYTDRARITTVRLAFSIFSSIVCVALPGMIINAYEGNDGYIVMSLAFGFVFMVCIGITALFAKEGIPAPKKTEKFNYVELLQPFRLKVFRQYLGLFLCCQMTMAIMSALFFFYVDFYFCADATASGQSTMVGMLGAAIMFGMQIVALPVYMLIIRKTSKMMAYIIGSLLWIVGALVLFIIPPNTDPLQIYLLAAVLGFGISGPGLIPHAIFGDVVDVGALKFGERTAGVFSGIANFVNTIAQAIGLALVMGVLGLSGFVEQDISEGAAQVLSQPESAQYAIVAVMALAPLVFMSVGIIFCSRYRLNKQRHALVLEALEGSAEEKEAVLRML
ncbi:MAG: MFS transporter [Coriobacteriia bacterium]|nr:MFS transporter [Coriobacteriia bacterium]